MTALRARDATPADAGAIAAIYNEGIDDRESTLETKHRTGDDVRAWLEAGSLVVAVENDAAELVAAAWTAPTSSRCAYRRNADFSVYVARRSRGHGAGTVAMRALVERARDAGIWKLMSGIFPENVASRRLLGALGFREVGTHLAHGELDGRWRDVLVVERIVAPTVLFACVHNAGRSQMAAAWFAALADRSRVRAISAGTEPAECVHPVVVEAMREVGIPLDGAKPQRLTEEIARAASLLVTMGCGEACPAVPGLEREDWALDDPKGQSIENARSIRDDIRARVVELLVSKRWDRKLA